MKEAFIFLWASIITFCGWFFGGADGILLLLVTLSVIDYLSGICVGWFEHNLSSSTGFKGIARKVFMFALVGIANLIDCYIMDNHPAAKYAACLFYISNEGFSILENAYKLGLPVPEILSKHFSAIRDGKTKDV